MVVIDLFHPLDSRGPEKCLTNEISVGLQANRCTECRLARVAKIVVDREGTLDAPFWGKLEHFPYSKSINVYLRALWTIKIQLYLKYLPKSPMQTQRPLNMESAP